MLPNIPWNKGKKGLQVSPRKGKPGPKASEATRHKMREVHRKRFLENGFINSPETRGKISAARISRKEAIGYINSPITRNKLSASRIGQKNWNYGKPRSQITKRKIGDAQIGSLNHAWRGGISFLPYSTDWTERLRRAIRERDRYTCRVCTHEPAIDVHHIDYNKQNCDPNNLITLCHSCHMKTNHDREAWFNFFLHIQSQ